MRNSHPRGTPKLGESAVNQKVNRLPSKGKGKIGFWFASWLALGDSPSLLLVTKMFVDLTVFLVIVY